MTTDSPRRRWFQFRLRTLLIAILVLSLPLSWFAARMRKAKRQREAVEAIEKAGGHTGSSFHDFIARASTREPERTWLRRLLGDDFFDPVSQAYLSKNTSDNDLEHLNALTRLRILDLRDSQVTDAGLEHLKGMPNLRWLYLQDTYVTDQGIKKLQQALPNCKIAH